ncbi:IQ domain-containing protein IQM3-like [Primulina eburnea]|uniref:IQ domain-containing protein IQM3-like n=1 Tax=Primulina eburnea TaxID=1245227 RepID=UPI003C6BEFF8
MEVQPHALYTFDNIPVFSFRDHPEFRISEISGSLEEVPGLQELTDKMTENGVEWKGTDAPARCSQTAAMKLQKVYRSYRTRRMLADSAVVAEELWWQAIDFARLNHSTISFFNFLKPETAALRWNRVILNASRVGKGLSKDDKAQKLAFQHWIEAIDPRHRYGHSLHIYYDEWCQSNAGQPFFYWLDLGDGKEVDLKECPRSKLRQQCIKYLGPQEREHYEYVVVDGKLLQKLSEKPLDTNGGSSGSKWIFVMSTTKRLYAGEKKKGQFHHSSFLAGGATLAAGRLVAEDGVLKCISPYSGHYKPTDESLDIFLSYLEENGVNLEEVEIRKANEDYDYVDCGKMAKDWTASEVSLPSESVPSDIPIEENHLSPETAKPSHLEVRTEYKRTLSGGLRSPKADVPKTAILERINSKRAAKSYQLGHQLSIKWSSGAGPRIGCVADYPVELRLQALELTNLSPRPGSSLPTPRRIGALLSTSARNDTACS